MTSAKLSSSADEVKRLQITVCELQNELQKSQNLGRGDFDIHAELRRKLNLAEREKLEILTNCNEKLLNCESQTAKLRSQVEKGEAIRQSLEYELAVARKDAGVERCVLEKMLVNANTEQEMLKAQKEELQKKLSDLQKILNISQHNWQEEEKQLKWNLEEKDNIIKTYKKENEFLTSERNKLDKSLQEKDTIIQKTHKRLEELETERIDCHESIKRQEKDLNRYCEREQQLKHEIEAASLREQKLKDDIEAECAASRDSKFNTDLLHLRIKEMEKALQTEKVCQAETICNLDKIRTLYKELEIICEKERANAEACSRKLSQLQEDCISTVKELKEEQEEKDGVIADLVQKFQKNEKSYLDIQKDLEQIKARNITLEDLHRDFHRDLQALVNAFFIPSVKSRTRTDDCQSPSLSIKALRETLLTYEYQIAQRNSELGDTKKKYEEKGKEAATAQECNSYLSRRLQDTNKKLTLVSVELDELREVYVKSKQLIDDLQKQLQLTNQSWDRDKELLTECHHQAESLMQSIKVDAEDTKRDLYGIYQHLVSGSRLQSRTDVLMGNFTIRELYDSIQEHINYLLEELEKEKQKVCRYVKMLQEKDDAMRALQRTHEETLEEITGAMKDQEKSCEKQKDDLTLHFSSLLKESQSRADQSQEIFDQTKERFAVLEKVKDRLSLENSKCKDQLVNSQQESASLLIACALMAGALCPLYNRSCALSFQRDILQEQLKTYEVVKQEIRAMTQAFSNAHEKKKHDSKIKNKHPKSMIHVFRKGVIAVLAANRLQYLGQSCNSLFTWIDVINEGAGIVVCGGSPRELSGQKSEQRRLHELVSWFRNSDHFCSVIRSVSDLQKILSTTDTSARSSGHLIVNAARCSFSKLMEHFCLHMTNVPVSRNLLRANAGSLSQRLACGLHKVDSKAVKAGFISKEPILKCLAALQRQICEFMQRLQKCEEERRAMRLEKAALKCTVEKVIIEADDTQNRQIQGYSHSNLSKVKSEMRRKDACLGQISTHISNPDQERHELEDSIHKAENCLQLSAK
ncbi:coiled-coil domain-containing protein 171-like [Ambystoma mexicanum]|uniref:coiled-coil domain-containing protein 171-like n=1 Tax=Ambystoma mexicanum TaxID=8296 RepID=UPI0037E81445